MVISTPISPPPRSVAAATVTTVVPMLRPWPNGPSQFGGSVSAASAAAIVSVLAVPFVMTVMFAVLQAATYAVGRKRTRGRGVG